MMPSFSLCVLSLLHNCVVHGITGIFVISKENEVLIEMDSPRVNS